jgi:hypothetical protein
MYGGQNIITWRDHEGINGFGSANEEDLSNLLKALSAGQDINPPANVVAGDGFALRVESLERTLRNVTFRMEHIRLFKALPKLQAYNTVEEYNQIQSYGEDLDSFIEEGALPSETDAEYERNFNVVKYMGTTRRVTHVMSLVRPAHGNVVAQETVNGTMHLLRAVEQSLFLGDAAVDPVQWDGFVKLIEEGPSTGGSGSPDSNILDLRGAPITEDNLIDSSLIVHDAPNYGTPTHLFLNPRNHADLVKSFFPKARYDLLQKRDDGLVGLDIGGYVSPAGNVAFEPDTFIQPGRIAPTQARGSNPPPAPSAVAAVAGTTGTPTKARRDGNTTFTAAEAGTYNYSVVAVGFGGKSAKVANAAAATVTAVNNLVTVTITDGAGAPTPRYYEVFRTEASGALGTERLIGRVRRDSSGTTTFVDANAELPGTTYAILFQMNLEAVSFKQLAPMVKIPLATVDTSIRWMQLVYGVPVLYTPGKILLMKNIGRASGSF